MPDLLLLEDDAALADGLQYSLARSGFAVTPARTLAQARACLRRWRRPGCWPLCCWAAR